MDSGCFVAWEEELLEYWSCCESFGDLLVATEYSMWSTMGCYVLCEWCIPGKGAWLQSEFRVECTWLLMLVLVLVLMRVVDGWMVDGLDGVSGSSRMVHEERLLSRGRVGGGGKGKGSLILVVGTAPVLHRWCETLKTVMRPWVDNNGTVQYSTVGAYRQF